MLHKLNKNLNSLMIYGYLPTSTIIPLLIHTKENIYLFTMKINKIIYENLILNNKKDLLSFRIYF